MFFYKIYGLVVKSDYELEAAYRIPENDEFDITICEGELDEELVTETEAELETGHGWYFYYCREWTGVRHVHQGAFCMKQGNLIEYKLKPESNRAYVCQVILGFCFSAILAQRGRMAIHGSCIVMNGNAVIISGDSGAGKSTITTALVQAGYQYMSDDIVAIDFTSDSVVAQSAFPQRKLCQDTMEKFKLNPDEFSMIPNFVKQKYGIVEIENFHSEDLQLKSMIILMPSEEEEVKLIPVTGCEKFKCVMDNIFNKMFYKFYGYGKREFDQCTKLANDIDIYILKRPAGKMTVDQQLELLQQCYC